MGDVHGHRDVLLELLRGAGLVDAAERWSGADARVWFVGDLVDRGPDGIGAIELVRRLERESGGARPLPARQPRDPARWPCYRFADEETSIPGQTFRELWLLQRGRRVGPAGADARARRVDDAPAAARTRRPLAGDPRRHDARTWSSGARSRSSPPRRLRSSHAGRRRPSTSCSRSSRTGCASPSRPRSTRCSTPLAASSSCTATRPSRRCAGVDPREVRRAAGLRRRPRDERRPLPVCRRPRLRHAAGGGSGAEA